MTKYPGVAVRAIITDSDGRILILKRQNTRYSNGQWCLPGGKVEFGCSVEDALCKEIHEETSLVCLNYHFLFYVDSMQKGEDRSHFINLFFRCQSAGEVTLNEESCAYTWAKIEELEKYELAFGHKEAITKALPYIV